MRRDLLKRIEKLERSAGGPMRTHLLLASVGQSEADAAALLKAKGVKVGLGDLIKIIVTGVPRSGDAPMQYLATR